MKAFIDCETCGFHGMPVTLQYAFDEEEVVIHEIWRTPVHETLSLIELIAECEVIGFNLAFDWFHLCKIYTTLRLFVDHGGDPNSHPVDHIDEIAVLEEQARFSNICLKPKAACDLMLVARKGQYQSLMSREPIRIKRVPRALAWKLAEELAKIPIDDIYFAKKKDKNAPRWVVLDHKLRNGKDDPMFKDVCLNFAASGALKTLATHALGIEEDAILKFTDIGVGDEYNPEELGYAPFALAIGKPGAWNKSWPIMIKFHINHWAFNTLARQYAGNDIVYTRGLYHYFNSPSCGDDDSTLSCLVAAVRWHGFAIDVEKLKFRRREALLAAKRAPISPALARKYIEEVMSELELVAFGDKGGTSKGLLEDIQKNWKCDCADGTEFQDNIGTKSKSIIVWKSRGCDRCSRSGPDGKGIHPAVVRSLAISKARTSALEAGLYDKLILAGRFHASFKVLGTLSARMSGADKLNPHGINRDLDVRECFILFDDGFILCGGDFDSFEVGIAAAAYNDKGLEEALRSGLKLHGIIAQEFNPTLTYDEVMADKKIYTVGKNCVFTMLFGGDEGTLNRKYGIPLEMAKIGIEGFYLKYPNVKIARDATIKLFCSMYQEGGIGRGKIIWKEPAAYIESLLGDRRYYTLENDICRCLYKLAQKVPDEWKQVKTRVVRRVEKGAQTASGATSSAIYAAAFAIQGAAMRSAANHVIQSTGARITKRVQCAVWSHQPHGVSTWIVQPMNIHDELLSPCVPSVVDAVKATVDKEVNSFKPVVPLIGMEWKVGMTSWASK